MASSRISMYANNTNALCDCNDFLLLKRRGFTESSSYCYLVKYPAGLFGVAMARLILAVLTLLLGAFPGKLYILIGAAECVHLAMQDLTM